MTIHAPLNFRRMINNLQQANFSISQALVTDISYANASFYGCTFASYQDTWYTGRNASTYVVDSIIFGMTDCKWYLLRWMHELMCEIVQISLALAPRKTTPHFRDLAESWPPLSQDGLRISHLLTEVAEAELLHGKGQTSQTLLETVMAHIFPIHA